MATKIMLDAGHYGKYNAGAISGYYESDMAWELHNYLKKELESYGFEVGVTRTNKNVDLEVYQRGLKARGYDLFISLHSNAIAGSESTNRVVIIPPISGVADNLAKKLGDTVLNTMNLKPSKYWYSQVYKRAYSSSKPNTDYYGVIRGAVAAGSIGIIIEHSFHTNKEACKWLMSSDNLKMLAKAEAKTIANYYGVKTTKPKDCTGKINGYNIFRQTDYLVIYNKGTNTGTNKWGSEVSVNSNGIATCTPVYGEGKMSIPTGGYVISGHGVASDWIKTNIKKGSKITINNGVIKVGAVVQTVNTNTKLSVGDKVKLVSGAKYISGLSIPSWLFNTILYVRGIRFNDQIVISTLKTGAVTGVVEKKYLKKI